MRSTSSRTSNQRHPPPWSAQRRRQINAPRHIALRHSSPVTPCCSPAPVSSWLARRARTAIRASVRRRWRHYAGPRLCDRRGRISAPIPSPWPTCVLTRPGRLTTQQHALTTNNHSAEGARFFCKRRPARSLAIAWYHTRVSPSRANPIASNGGPQRSEQRARHTQAES